MMKQMVEMSSFEEEEAHMGTTTISRRQLSRLVPNLTKAVLILVVCSMASFLFSAFKDSFPNNGLWSSPPPHHFELSKKDEPDELLLPKDKLLLGEWGNPAPVFNFSGRTPGGRNFAAGPIGTNLQSVSPASQKVSENSTVGSTETNPSMVFSARPIKSAPVLGDLLPKGFDERSCLSRYQTVLNHRKQKQQPSPHLVSRLRQYELLHKRCGPYTESYNRTLSGARTNCSYIILIPVGGLGNKMLSLASAFLYALLTNRILLVDPGGYIPDLFCQPFPDASWFVPPGFPIIRLHKTFEKSPYSYGNMQRHNLTGGNSVPPPYVYLNLLHSYDHYDQVFFCDQGQTLLQKVPFLISRSNQYFVPSLFLIQTFEEELDRLFPEKAAVFHLLSQYLFHPTNTVWRLVTRYYKAYLARADEIIGIQLRTYGGQHPIKYVMDQIMACVRKENLLPEIHLSKEPKKTKAVLMASLSSGYSDALREMYREHQIEVYQPSHEEYQQTQNKMHNIKALAEIYLLSLTDKLVTSSTSTFGYVAQSLGGLKPWILPKFKNQTVRNPPCKRAVSMEPCFHYAPAQGCGSKEGIKADKTFPHIQHCEDMRSGLKLVNIDKGF